VNETHQFPCLKRKLVHSALLCIWFVDKKQIRQTQCMESSWGTVAKKCYRRITTIGK